MTEVDSAKTQAPKHKAKGHGRKAAQDYPGALEKPPAEKFCGNARSPQQHLSSECSVTSTGVGWAGRWSSTTGTTSPNRSDQHHRPRAALSLREMLPPSVREAGRQRQGYIVVFMRMNLSLTFNPWLRPSPSETPQPLGGNYYLERKKAAHRVAHFK